MLRLLVGALLIANLAFWAWTQPAITAALGGAPPDGREPERLARQLQPEAVRVVPLAAASSASGPAAGATAGSGAEVAAAVPPEALACLETPPLAAAQVASAVQALQAVGVPAGGWVELRRERPGRWMLYMGRFSDRDQAARKGSELAAMRLPFEELLVGDWAPGLRLGEFGSAAEAQARLNQLQGRGVRTARVVTLSPPGQELRLRADRLPAVAAERLQAAERAASTPGLLAWQPCDP